ncbi:MAG: hypothetical protein ABS897_06605 [Eubacteriales bacterium]
MGFFTRYYSLGELTETEKKAVITAMVILKKVDASLDCSTVIDAIEKDKLTKGQMIAVREVAKLFREKVLPNREIYTETDPAKREKYTQIMKKAEDLVTEKIG